MIGYDFRKDFIYLRHAMGLSLHEFAEALGMSFVTLANYENGIAFPTEEAVEALHRLAYANKLDINFMRTRFLEDNKKGRLLLYHGSRNGVNGDINLVRGRVVNDFGLGFYMGETLNQASNWVCEYRSGSVYCLYLDINGLKGISFDVDREWMLAICFYRGYLKGKENHPLIRAIREKVEEADYIRAPIADNLMYETLMDFANGNLTDEQCFHALSANQLGYQVICRTQKAIDHLEPATRLYLGAGERKDARNCRAEERQQGIAKLRIARNQYQNEGKYIDAIIA